LDKHAANERDLSASLEEGETGQNLEPGEGLVAPGVPVVRSSTPRPPSHAASTASTQDGAIFEASFPSRAPVAPPLPEEPEAQPSTGADGMVKAPSFFALTPAEQDDASEFAWLFEYGLEMDPAYLNSPERLDGLAHRFGPAVLKGYGLRSVELPNGRIAPTLVKFAEQGNEVWGILYRVPRRLLAPAVTTPSALDIAHPAPAFAPLQIHVQEIYRKRSIECIAYTASEPAGRGIAVLPPEQRRLDSEYAQQLLHIGRQQGLPAAYLEELAENVVVPANNAQAQAQRQQPQHEQSKHVEQDTEPLPALIRGDVGPMLSSDKRQEVYSPQSVRWFFALALYLVLLMMATLVLAVMQALGYWEQVFVPSFSPLGVPWHVLLYGLLGGCVSCMMSLGRQSGGGRQPSRSTRSLPGFVVITWFTRPYLGAILAALAYFVLNSGLFMLSIVPSQRFATYAVAGAIAGLSEGRFFFRQRRV
jgi:hypothetical protein